MVPAFVEAMKPFKENIHKIPLNSGKAFRDHESLRKKVNTPIYFAPPYPFWERGLRKNIHGRFRPSFPQNRNLKNLAWKEFVALSMN